MDVKNVKFPEFGEESRGERIEQKFLRDIPVQAKVELGEASLSLKEMLEIEEGSIIELNRLAGEPLDIKVGGQLIAQGEVVAIDDYYGVRITNVVIK